MRENTSVAAANRSLELKLTLNSFTPFPNQPNAPHLKNATQTSSTACQMVVGSRSTMKWNLDITKGQGTGNINFVHYNKVSLYESSFSYILPSLG